MKGQKYPASLFFFGFLTNLARYFFLTVPAVILLLLGIVSRWCLLAGAGLLLLAVLLALAEQLLIWRQAQRGDAPELDELRSAFSSPDWKEALRKQTEETLDRNHR